MGFDNRIIVFIVVSILFAFPVIAYEMMSNIPFIGGREDSIESFIFQTMDFP